jgi:hypothetical protein
MNGIKKLEELRKGLIDPKKISLYKLFQNKYILTQAYKIIKKNIKTAVQRTKQGGE